MPTTPQFSGQKYMEHLTSSTRAVDKEMTKAEDIVGRAVLPKIYLSLFAFQFYSSGCSLRSQSLTPMREPAAPHDVEESTCFQQDI